MSTTQPPSQTEDLRQQPGQRLVQWLMPTEVNGWVRAMAWASMIAHAMLILTGGLVRLTASGLGCPTWPRCTEESWTNTAEMGIHGIIEFGNRTLTGVLVLIAVLTFLAVWKVREEHPILLNLAISLGAGVALQALVGGITVLTQLNPNVVGVHFIISAALVAIGAVMVNRTRRISLPQVRDGEVAGSVAGSEARQLRTLMWAMAVAGSVTIYIGTLVTGTGPHAGDAGEVVRHTFDAVWITRAHTLPAYVTLGLAVAALVMGARRGWPAALRRSLTWVIVAMLAQALIGYYQYFNGVPVVAVALHLVGAAALCALLASATEKGLMLASRKGQIVAPGGPTDVSLKI